MSVLYVYEQILIWQGLHTNYVSLSRNPPEKCGLSEPVKCLGTIEVSGVYIPGEQESRDEYIQ